MRRIVPLLTALAGLPALAACVAVVPYTAASAPTEPIQQWEMEQWQSPRFDVLRHRMPLYARDVTFAMLNSTARVSAAERDALAEWAEIQLEAQRRALDAAWVTEPPEMVALGEAARSRYTTNLLEVYNGVVTWGEFNRRTLIISAEFQNALAQVRALR